jgi:hypothetical protein
LLPLLLLLLRLLMLMLMRQFHKISPAVVCSSHCILHHCSPLAFAALSYIGILSNTCLLLLHSMLGASRRVSFIGCCMASALTGKGPITLLFEHIGDPLHNTIMQTLQ